MKSDKDKRKAASVRFVERQRELKRKKQVFWITDDEHIKLKSELEEIRREN